MTQFDRPSATFRKAIMFSLGVLTVAVVCALLYKLRYVLLLFCFAGFLAYFLNWPITMLARKLGSKTATRVVFYVFFFGLLGSIGPIGTVLYYQATGFISHAPEYIRQIPNTLTELEQSVNDFQGRFNPGLALDLSNYLSTLVAQVQERAPELISRAFDVTQTFLSGTATVLAGLIVIPLIALYLLIDGKRLRKALLYCFPERMREDIDLAANAVNHALSGYIYSRVLLALFVGVGMTIALSILGVPYSLILGLLVFLGEFVPVIGNLLAFIPIVIVCLANDPISLLWAVIFALLINIVQNYVIAPKLSGEAMNLHPLTVILSMLAGGFLGGAAGLVLALPITAALKVILNIFVFKRKEQGIYLPELESMRFSEKAEPAATEVATSGVEPDTGQGNSHDIAADNEDQTDKHGS